MNLILRKVLCQLRHKLRAKELNMHRAVHKQGFALGASRVLPPPGNTGGRVWNMVRYVRGGKVIFNYVVRFSKTGCYIAILPILFNLDVSVSF